MRRWIAWLQPCAASPELLSCRSWLTRGDAWRGFAGAGGTADRPPAPDQPRVSHRAESEAQPSAAATGPSAAAAQAPTAPAATAPPALATSRRDRSMPSLELLERFLTDFQPTPPVSFIRAVGVPTALSWMRRRGPDVPHAVLYRLFRQRQIRLYDGETIRRVSPSRPLENGDLLLYPNWLTPSRGGGGVKQHPQQHLQRGQQDPAARAAAVAAAAAAVRKSARRDRCGSSAGDAGADGEEAADAVRLRSHSAAGPRPGTGTGTTSSAAAERAAAAGVVRNTKRTAQPSVRSDTASAGSGDDEPPPPPPPPQQQLPALVVTPERVRRWVLSVHPGLLFLNKPAGVRVHGRAAGDEPVGGRGRGRGGASPAGGGGMRPPVPQSLDEVMQRALKFGEGDEPRLVHRLDQAASGVMVVARNADAATWLCAAFRDKAERALAGERRGGGGEAGAATGGEGRGRAVGRSRGGYEEGEEEGEGPGGHPSVLRTYWAFLAGDLQPRQSGRISLPVVVDGVSCPAVTSYRVKATGCGISWVELTPETGRRHQLRVHCARKLGAPILGDERYGYRGLPPTLRLRDRLPPEWWALLGDDPRVVRRRREAAGEADPPSGPVLLHSRELVVVRPGRASLTGVAPLPRYIRQLIEAAGWPLPTVG